MAGHKGVINTPTAPVIMEQFPDYPQGVTKDGVFDLLDQIDSAIVGHHAKHTPGIDGGIVAIRGIRDALTQKPTEAAGILRYYVGSIEFQLRGNLHTIKIGEEI